MKLTLVGTCSFDPNGKDQLMNTLKSLEPEVIFVSLPPNIDSRSLTDNDYGNLTAEMIRQLPSHETFIHYLIPKLRNIIGYEYRAIKEYSDAAKTNTCHRNDMLIPIKIIGVDSNYVDKEKIIASYCELFCELINRCVPNMDFTNKDVLECYSLEFLQKLYLTNKEYVLVNAEGEIREWEEFMVKNIVSEIYFFKKCVFVGGYSHIHRMKKLFAKLECNADVTDTFLKIVC